MRMNFSKFTISRKISYIVLGMIIFGMSLIGVFSYYLYRNNSVSSNANRAMAIAESVASIIKPEEFKEIISSNEKNQYWYDTKQYVDDIMMRTGVLYLYILDKNYDDNVRYFMEGSEFEEDSLDLGSEESVEYHADELFATLESGESSVTGIYSAEEYGIMVSGFAPILDGNNVIGVVGIDISLEDVMESTNFFRLAIIIFIFVVCIICCVVSAIYVKRSVGDPIMMLSQASTMIAQGDMNISLTFKSKDEIGTLTESFLNMIDSTKKQIKALEMISNGDLTADIVPRSDNDSMGFALKKTIDNLNSMFEEIKSSTAGVLSGSEQIAKESRMLAEDASEQAAAVEQLSSSLTCVTGQAEQSTELANNSASLANSIMSDVEKGNNQMDDMISSINEINSAGQEILKVIKVIDDIAFQTNILALNASVEAARAGQHGKGFAIVAEEVRNLASKSAEAAKDTERLIANSVQKAEQGSAIANETAKTLNKIVSEIGKSNKFALDIAKTSEKQAAEITHMGIGINQISQVIQNNSAAAQESAATSEQMSNQANVLEELVERFVLK